MRQLMRLLCRAVKISAIVGLCALPFLFLLMFPELTLPEHGSELGRIGEQPVRSNQFGSMRGEYGLEFECVELINRVYAVELGHKNMAKSGHADSYFYDPRSKGLVAYPQGGDEPPRPWDILVFDGGPDDGSPGHVAIVIQVDEENRKVTFVQQNFVVHHLAHWPPWLRQWVPWLDYRWHDQATIEQIDGAWHVTTDPNIKYPPVVGWSRRKS